MTDATARIEVKDLTMAYGDFVIQAEPGKGSRHQGPVQRKAPSQPEET